MNKGSLLLVDDDRRIRDLLSRFLAGEGYRVTTAASAGAARAMAGLAIGAKGRVTGGARKFLQFRITREVRG